jgi:hypothetical protein
VFEQMREEGLFVRLVELLKERRESDPLMWKICLDLLYEMSRIQRLRKDDLGGYYQLSARIRGKEASS